MSGRSKFKKFKKIINMLAFIAGLLPKKLLLLIWDMTSRYSGNISVVTRYIIAKKLCNTLGENVYIGKGVTIKGWDKLKIGKNVSIHDYCYIDANGEIDIGDNVSIAHQSSILSFDHSWHDESTPIKYNETIFKKVVVSDDVWIGCGCRIMSGVYINSRSIVAAGSIVTKDVSSRTIVGGVPAKPIKNI